MLLVEKKSFFQVIAVSLEAFTSEPRCDWVKKWPGQAVLCVTQKFWTESVENAFTQGPQVRNVIP